ncbi:hypothetical protein P3S67_017606 [Capsicum chacoense]
MEGLIPLVYKTIKRSKTRRKYECLSIGVANTYNIENFYPNNITKQYEIPSIDDQKMVVDNGGGDHIDKERLHRRTQSLHVDSNPMKDKQLVKLRSHRRMFSCVSGV